MNEKDFIYMANLLFVNYKFVLYFQLGNNSFDRIIHIGYRFHNHTWGKGTITFLF